MNTAGRSKATECEDIFLERLELTREMPESAAALEEFHKTFYYASAVLADRVDALVVEGVWIARFYRWRLRRLRRRVDRLRDRAIRRYFNS